MIYEWQGDQRVTENSESSREHSVDPCEEPVKKRVFK